VRSGDSSDDVQGEAKTKGVGFVNVRAFATERFGANGWEQTIERLSHADRDVLAAVLPVGWYPLALYARLIRALDDVHGAGDLTLVVQLGRFEAERDLTTIHRIFLRMANPAFAIEKFGDYWRRFHDSGDWKLQRIHATSLGGTLSEWGVVDYALCRELVGYMGRVLELVGARSVIMEHPRCRGRGDAECYFQARWGATSERDSGTMLADSGAVGPARQEAVSEVVVTPRDAFAASVEKLGDTSKRRAGGG
jgi:hypothetical protein